MPHNYYPDIIERIPSGSRVLDLGCGNGDLLTRLKTEKNTIGYGVDIQFENIKSCIQKGIPVFQGDIDEGLEKFKTHSFDWVILSQTLQQVQDPVKLLQSMLRVGKKIIVTFPNFGHIKVRFHHGISGHSPQTKTLPFPWYNTPNIRVITLLDFRKLCQSNHIKIEEEVPLFHNQLFRSICPKSLYNLFSPKGLFICHR